jgi:RsiW-degrading membrane proteinase PrsW (M82 family)
MTYFVMPMVLISKQNNINAMNYGVLALFISYIVLDLFIKHSLQCIPTIFSSLVIGNLLGGLLCGVIAVMVMYGSTLKNYLYINEVNTNKEVCSMPSKQQFKCRVFKVGTLIGDI